MIPGSRSNVDLTIYASFGIVMSNLESSKMTKGPFCTIEGAQDVLSSVDAVSAANRVFRVATTNRAASDSSVHVFPTDPSKVITGRQEFAEGVLHAASTGVIPLAPRKKAQAPEEGSVGVSAAARLCWDR